jgi:hypothetical protein
MGIAGKVKEEISRNLIGVRVLSLFEGNHAFRSRGIICPKEAPCRR